MTRRTPKYIHFTDTEIVDMITNFYNMLCFVEEDIFYKYITRFNSLDLQKHEYNKRNILIFLATLIDFISKKENKLRVRSDLKMNKSQVLSLIFNDITDMSLFSKDIRYWFGVLFEFYFSNYEIFEHIDNMLDNYAAMYDTYLANYDKTQN